MSSSTGRGERHGEVVLRGVSQGNLQQVRARLGSEVRGHAMVRSLTLVRATARMAVSASRRAVARRLALAWNMIITDDIR